MKLEAIDPLNLSAICVATVRKVSGDQLPSLSGPVELLPANSAPLCRPRPSPLGCRCWQTGTSWSGSTARRRSTAQTGSATTAPPLPSSLLASVKSTTLNSRPLEVTCLPLHSRGIWMQPPPPPVVFSLGCCLKPDGEKTSLFCPAASETVNSHLLIWEFAKQLFD